MSNQSHFQVRFDFGHRGSTAITPGAHVLVWCDALPTGIGVPEFEGTILLGTTGNAEATAAWILALQATLEDRAVVAVVAAGTNDEGFAVEDLLAAGAVIDALATIGLDANSPEAAAACAAYEGLRNATAHLTSASTTGQLLGPGVMARAMADNAEPAVRVLRES